MDLSNLKMSGLLKTDNNVVDVELELIKSLPQVRVEGNLGFEGNSLAQLANSIKSIGVQQPILLRPDPKNKNHYIIVCGERRFRASKLAGKQTIPAIIREDLTDNKDITIIQITENLQREGITNMEIAVAANTLIQMGMKSTEVAEKLGTSVSHVSELLRMLDMPAYLMNLLSEGKLSSSPRTCAEYARLYEQFPQRLESYIDAYILEESADDSEKPLLDRSVIKKFKQFIEAEDHPAEDTNKNAATALSEDNSTESVENTDDETGETEGESDNFIADKDHSETPKMFSPNQENDAPTAQVGSSSDFTDKDTKAAHDLSDSISYSEKSNEDFNSSSEESETSEENLDLIEGFLVEYHGENYVFNLEKGADEEHILIINSKGVASEVLLKEVKLIRVL